jgi:hypothetical protein
MPAKHGLNWLESCKNSKYFFRPGRPKNLRIGHGGPGQLIFFYFTYQDGPWHRFFGRFRAGRAGTVGIDGPKCSKASSLQRWLAIGSLFWPWQPKFNALQWYGKKLESNLSQPSRPAPFPWHPVLFPVKRIHILLQVHYGQDKLRKSVIKAIINILKLFHCRTGTGEYASIFSFTVLVLSFTETATKNI